MGAAHEGRVAGAQDRVTTMLNEIWSVVRFRIRALFDRDALERELDDELSFHLECEA